MAEVEASGMAVAAGGRRQHSEQYWREQVAGWQGSGLTQIEYCRRGGLSWCGFHYWKVKVEAERVGGGTEEKLVEVRMPKTSGGREGGEIRIRVGGRYVVEVGRGFDGSVLSRLLDALESR